MTTSLRNLTTEQALACTDLPQLYDSTDLADHTIAAVACKVCPLAAGCRQLALEHRRYGGDRNGGVNGTYGGSLFVNGQEVAA